MFKGLLAAVVLAGSAGAQCRTIALDGTDALAASPANHAVLFEDADVRVLDVHSQPHTREAVHTHAMPSVMYIERQGAGTFSTPDGNDFRSHPTDPNFKPRLLTIKPEGPHWTENTGDVAFHAIRVEFKHPGCGLAGWKMAMPGKDDALVVSAGSHTLLAENADVRVLDVHVAPHDKVALHTHPWPGVFYVAQASPVREDGELKTLSAGMIVPMKAEAHAVENVGDAPLHLIWFELKFATP